MGKAKLLLLCSASKEKEYKSKFGSLIIHKSEFPDENYPCCMPVFRCEDLVITANALTGKKEKVMAVSYQPRSFSPTRHVRIGTMYGENYEEIQEAIDSLKRMEDLSVG